MRQNCNNLKTGTISEFICSAGEYFRRLDYHVPSTFEKTMHDMLFNILKKGDLEKATLMSLEPYIETIISKTPKETITFHEDYIDFVDRVDIQEYDRYDEKELKQKKQGYDSLDTEIKEVENSIEKEVRSLESVDKKLKEVGDQPKVGQRTTNKRQKQYDEIRKEYEECSKGLDNRLRHFPEYLEDGRAGDLSDLSKDISKMLDRVIMSTLKQKELLEYVKWQMDVVKKSDNFKERHNIKALTMTKQRAGKSLEKLQERKKRLQERLEEKNKEYPKIQRIIQKKESIRKRERFIEGHNSVQQNSIITGVPDKAFDKLDYNEKVRIRNYIGENSSYLNTILSHNIRTKQHKRIDFPETIKKACETGGVPIRLSYIRPRKQKAKLLMFLDVSGSCKEASGMMLSFMHAMKKSFPGGCQSYVFVNSLYDVSEYFEEEDTDAAIENILSTVPRKGVYSDYYTPIRQFCEEHISEVDKNTFVFFMGDARNNQNPTGEEYMRKIKDRAKRVFFMNTEKRNKWNKADSIIGIYENIVDRAEEITTPKKLMEFMARVK